MDVRCGRCGTEYDFDDTLISERGTTVQCTECGFQFKVFPNGPLAVQERWLVRSGTGAAWEREYESLRELQWAIQNGDVGPMDLLSRGAGVPRALASIAELEPLFRQRVVRSGGTLLGIVPEPARPAAELAPPTEAVPAKRRVETKLGMPVPSQPLVAAPVVAAPLAPPPPDVSSPVVPPPAEGGPPPMAPAPAEVTRAPAVTTSFSAVRSAVSAASQVPATDFGRTLPSFQPMDVAPAGLAAGVSEEEPTAGAPGGAGRPKIQSALTAGKESAGPEVVAPQTPAADLGGTVPGAPRWGHQTLPSLVHVAPAAAGEALRVSEPGRPAPAGFAATLPSAVSPVPHDLEPPRTGPVGAASPAASAAFAQVPGPARPAAPSAAEPKPVAQPLAAPSEASLSEPVELPGRRGPGRWLGAALLAAAAVGALLWRVGRDEEASPNPAVAAAEPAPAPAVPAPPPEAAAAPAGTEVASSSAAPGAADESPAVQEPASPARPRAAEPVDYRTRLAQAARAAQEGELAKAQAHYEAVLREQPGNVEAQAGLAEVAQRRGKTKQAAELYEAVLASHPSYVPALLGRGDQLWNAGERASALKLYRRVVEQVGTSGSYGARAQARIEQGKAEGVQEKANADGADVPSDAGTPPAASARESSSGPESND
jgi:DNA-directed RNA polymerase subunit RPC12/RpoP